MTLPTGKSFISYRRTRLDEVKDLVASQKERGIPTWQDIEDLRTEPYRNGVTKRSGERRHSRRADVDNAGCWSIVHDYQGRGALRSGAPQETGRFLHIAGSSRRAWLRGSRSVVGKSFRHHGLRQLEHYKEFAPTQPLQRTSETFPTLCCIRGSPLFISIFLKVSPCVWSSTRGLLPDTNLE